jgi:hypothetical protein
MVGWEAGISQNKHAPSSYIPLLPTLSSLFIYSHSFIHLAGYLLRIRAGVVPTTARISIPPRADNQYIHTHPHEHTHIPSDSLSFQPPAPRQPGLLSSSLSLPPGIRLSPAGRGMEKASSQSRDRLA